MAPAGFLWLPTCSEHRPAVCALFGKKHGPGRVLVASAAHGDGPDRPAVVLEHGDRPEPNTEDTCSGHATRLTTARSDARNVARRAQVRLLPFSGAQEESGPCRGVRTEGPRAQRPFPGVSGAPTRLVLARPRCTKRNECGPPHTFHPGRNVVEVRGCLVRPASLNADDCSEGRRSQVFRPHALRPQH